MNRHPHDTDAVEGTGGLRGVPGDRPVGESADLAEVRRGPVGLVRDLFLTPVPSPVGERGLSGALATVGWANFSVMIPIIAIVTFDDLFFGVGLGLEAGMALTMTYAFYSLRRALARGRRRRQIEPDDPNDMLEETADYLSDFTPVAVLVFIIFWLLPALPYFMEANLPWTAIALGLGAGVAGISGIAGLHEGMRRFLAHTRAHREVDLWDPADLLHAGPELSRADRAILPPEQRG